MSLRERVTKRVHARIESDNKTGNRPIDMSLVRWWVNTVIDACAKEGATWRQDERDKS